nr:cytochrome b [Rhabdopleura sp. NHMO H2137]
MSLREGSVGVYAFNHFITDVKCPMNLSYMWGFGSILGLGLAIQILTGILLAIYFVNTSEGARGSIIHLEQDVVSGWFMRSLHVNGASFMFVCLYLHVGRAIYYAFYSKSNHAWWSGLVVLILCWASAFFGYVLPWGQMSFWGATVITNLFTTIPFFGDQIVDLLWGGFVISGVTLKRFYVFHFLCPIIMGLGVLFHMWLIHQQGSSNPVTRWSVLSVNFHPLYTYKDLVGFWAYVGGLVGVCLYVPGLFSDPVNLIPADPFKTPNHMVPEWYFLFFYGVLRSIPNKSWGALAAAGVVVNLFMAGFKNGADMTSCKLRFWGWTKFWMIVGGIVVVTMYGASPAGSPYEDILRVGVLFVVGVLKFWGTFINNLSHDMYRLLFYHKDGFCWFSDLGGFYSYGSFGEKVFFGSDFSFFSGDYLGNSEEVNNMLVP